LLCQDLKGDHGLFQVIAFQEVIVRKRSWPSFVQWRSWQAFR